MHMAVAEVVAVLQVRKLEQGEAEALVGHRVCRQGLMGTVEENPIH